MKSGLIVIAICALSLVAHAAENDQAAQDQAKLQGVWQVVSMKVEGKAAAPPEDVIKTMKLTIKGNTMSHPGAEGKSEEATFTLDPSKQPKTLDMSPSTGVDKGKTILGLYSLDGDSLKLCAGEPGTDRPTELRAGEHAVLIELKREKP